MLNQHSLEEIADIYNLLGDIKKEYEKGIKPVLLKNSPTLFRNPHTVPKLKKIQINRGLGLAAQNTNILRKNIEEFEKITGQKPIITKSKKAMGVSQFMVGMLILNFGALTFALISIVRVPKQFGPKSGNSTINVKNPVLFTESKLSDC